MEKNKNRTDLLAAGRKKLQQYRQKKDVKGSKASGKANKAEADMVTDETSSVSKVAKGKNKQLPATEVPAQDSVTEPVDSSNVDIVTSDISSALDLPIEVSEADEPVNASVSDEYQQSSNIDDAMPTVSSPRTASIDENPDSGYVSVSPIGLKPVFESDMVTDESSVSEVAKGKTKQLPATEVPAQDSAIEPIDSSNVDVVTSDLSFTSDLPIEVSEADESVNASVSDEYQQSSNLDDAMPTVSSPRTANIDENPNIDYMSVSPVGLKPVFEPDMVTDESSSVSEVEKGKNKQLPATEVPAQDSAIEPVDSSNVDVVTSDLSSTSDLPVEVSEADESVNASVSDEYQQSSNLDDAMPTVSSPRTANTDENINSDYVSVAPVGLNPVFVGDMVTDESSSFSEVAKGKKEQLPATEVPEPVDSSNVYVETSHCSSTSDLPIVVSEADESLNASVSDEYQDSSNLNDVMPTVSSPRTAYMDENPDSGNVSVAPVGLKPVFEPDMVTDESSSVSKVAKGEKEQLPATEMPAQDSAIEPVDSSNVDVVTSDFSSTSDLQIVVAEADESVSASVSDEYQQSSNLDDVMATVSSFRTTNINENPDSGYVSVAPVGLKPILDAEMLTDESSSVSEIAKGKKKQLPASEVPVQDSVIEPVEVSEADESVNVPVSDEYQQSSNLKYAMPAVSSPRTANIVENPDSDYVSMAPVELKPVLDDDFELKGHTDGLEEMSPPTEDSEPHTTVKKNIDNLEYAENASELLLVNTSGKTPSGSTLEEIMVHFEAMKELSNNLEETFLKHVILDEFVKQYVCTVEAKKDELVVLCEESRQEGITTKAYNSELTEKLSSSDSRIIELEAQVDELQQQADHMASVYNQLETLHKKLDSSISTIPTTHSSDTVVDQNISTRVASSVDAAVAVIQNLQEKVEDALRNNNLLSDSYNELAEKTKDLEGRNELSSYVIHKVFNNLQKIVNDLAPSTEQSEEDMTSEQLDHLEISNYDVFIERLIMILCERSQLESKNREYNLELLRRIKDMEELNKRCISPDVIVKLFEDIQCSVTLDGVKIEPDEPVSSLESMIQFLVKKLKSNDMKLIKLQGELDHLTFSIVPYEIENLVLKESLSNAMEHLVTIQSEAQIKETEHHQSEQRISALREKLHIAVTKGKGLIQHRDSLKQNLSAKSSELEKCLLELQLKEATLQETEAKLKSHSEAGERIKALESELSYIRNSATALRESFLLKDSVLERIEEILEDLDLPEDFHVRDIIDKIDWLAKSVSQSQNSFPFTSLNQTSLIERTRSYPESGLQVMDGWIEDIQPSSGPADDELRRNYDELQNKYYGLAEHNEMLEQSLMERNNLVQRVEEVLDKINMPSQLRSLEPENRIEWLRVSLLEANDRCDLFQQDINDLEKIRGSLAADLEESQRRLADLESTLKLITDEHGQLSASLEAQSRDYNQVFEKSALYEVENDKLKNEVGALQLKLEDKRGDEVHIHHVNGEIRRLQDVVKDLLKVPETEDIDSSTSDIQYLEVLLRKLVDKHITATSELTHGERSVDQSDTNGELERKLEEVESDLVRVSDERDQQVETNQSLVNEVEALKAKNHELQSLLAQEEQKCATVKEKLNVAVRKGKSLVQVRDNMKQTINDLTSQVERLNDEIKVRENSLMDHQEKMKDLFTLQEMVENKESEIRFLKNRLEEADSELLDKRNTLTMILGALTEIDLGVKLRTDDPVEKLKQVEEVIHDFQVAISSAEQESIKSKSACELLLAELNEIQERNEDLLEEISELSEQRDSAEAEKRESLSHLQQLSARHLEERSSQLSELMNLKSGLDQLRPGFSKIYGLLNDVLPKDLDYLYNLEASVKSLLEIRDTENTVGQTRSSSHVTVPSELFFDSKTVELQLHDENKIIDLWRFIGTHMQGLITNINGFEEKLESHSKCLHEEIIILSETVATLCSELTSYRHSIESTDKQKETEILMLHKYISMLYEACEKSVLEMEKTKGRLVPNHYSGESISSGETSVSEERITSMVNRLLTAVKDFYSIQSETLEINLKEMKSTISSLQKELTEKDVQKDRICVDLVSQIKQAEAAAMSHLQELKPAKAQINDLKGQLEAVNLQRNSLEQKVVELESQESELVDLHGKVKSLTDALTAKEQEAEALLQALDEEEAQMEEMTNKITELERVVQQKNLDLENSEAARGKALKKLSITVAKFDELHRLSETLVFEVDKLQSQLQERDSEISFLRDEITRCTSDSLQALETDKKSVDEIQDILTWLDSMVSGVEMNKVHVDENKTDQVHEYKKTLKKRITSIISELSDLRQVSQSKDDLLHIERSKVDDLIRRRELLESSLREKESKLSLHENDTSSAQRTSLTSEIVEVEPVLNKWPSQGTSTATQVRSLRKVNNDQLAISIDDRDTDDKDKLEDDDDDKAHGFKSLTTSKLVPKFTRPVTDFVDGLWVSCDRTLMRQPALRLSLIFYWAVMHTLLAVFVV